MINKISRCLLAAVAPVTAATVLNLGWTASSALANDFYKGKTIKVIIRSSAGGGNDFYGRLMAKYMPRHIPGKPSAIPLNMPGASGIVAANYIHNRAKRDGTEFGILARTIAIAQRTGVKGVRYDVRNLIPLGSTASDTAIFVVKNTSPIKTLQDLKRSSSKIRVSTTGVTGGAYQRAKVLQHEGYPMEMITGYGGNDEKVLALVRGEVTMTAGSYGTMISDVREHNFHIIGKLGPMRDGIPAGTPDLRDVVTGERKQLATFLVAPLEAGRPFYAPPKVPADQITLLRAAFSKALADPKLLEEAKRARQDISPTTPEEMLATNQKILASPMSLVENFKRMTRPQLKTYKGKITVLANGNKQVTLKRENGEEFQTKLSGSRTSIKVSGGSAKRKALQVGMACVITAPGNKQEAKTVDCR